MESNKVSNFPNKLSIEEGLKSLERFNQMTDYRKFKSFCCSICSRLFVGPSLSHHSVPFDFFLKRREQLNCPKNLSYLARSEFVFDQPFTALNGLCIDKNGFDIVNHKVINKSLIFSIIVNK